MHTVLIVDDEKHTREGLKQALQEQYQVYVAADSRQALEVFDIDPADVVLTDLRMGDSNGLALIEALLKKPRPPICLLMTAYGSVDNAVEAMKRGAYDFLTKPLKLAQLEIKLRRALKDRALEQENQALHQRLDQKYQFSQIVGHSEALGRVLEQVRYVAPARSTVLLQGETGTGKELFAQALHQNSPWSRGPFIAVNCAALATNLLESELFGHEKGAFTGAQERRIGRFESAHGGTLFLDEIGEVDASTQVKLLRFLENRTIERLGSHTPISVELRLVCATHRNLKSLVGEGRFREDLYYRLSVIVIELPPLRQRTEDIPLLLGHYLERFSQENRLPPPSLSSEVLQVLCAYSWPGNIRQLRNFCENKVVIQRGRPVELKDLEPSFFEPSAILPAPPLTSAASPVLIPASTGQPLAPNPLSLKAQRRQMLAQALQQARYNRTQAAALLGVHRRTLHRMLKEFPELA